jgi:hypothetical protein
MSEIRSVNRVLLESLNGRDNCEDHDADGRIILFMSMGWDHVCELRPQTGLLFIPPRWHECVDTRWNGIDRENRRTWRNPCTSAIFLTSNPHMDWPGRESGPRRWEVGDEPPETWHGLRMTLSWTWWKWSFECRHFMHMAQNRDRRWAVANFRIL